MRAWDEKIRARERSNRAKKEISLIPGEELKLKMLGSFFIPREYMLVGGMVRFI